MKGAGADVQLEPGRNLVFGELTSFDGSTIRNFNIDDQIFVVGAQIAAEELVRNRGSAILSYDADKDGLDDLVLTLAGDFRLSGFEVESVEGGTFTTYAGNQSPEFDIENFFTVVSGEARIGSILATDADSEVVSYSIAEERDGSLFSVDSSTGALTFLAPPDFSNPEDEGRDNVYNLMIIADDGDGGSASQIVIVEVKQGNQSPSAQADDFWVSEDGFLVGNVLADNGSGEDCDADGDVLTVSLISSTLAGALTLNPDGSFEYIVDADVFDLADAGETISEEFVYEVTDGNGGRAQAIARIDVSVQNDGVHRFGTIKRDELVGTDGGEDKLIGFFGRDLLIGLDGADTLYGGFGRDTLDGGDSADLLDGGPGRDHLIGGAGEDVFRFGFFGGRDRIENFEVGIDLIGVGHSLFVDSYSDLVLRDRKDGVLVKMGGASVLLENVWSDDLTADSFVWL